MLSGARQCLANLKQCSKSPSPNNSSYIPGIALYGFGRVGRELARRIMDRTDFLFKSVTDSLFTIYGRGSGTILSREQLSRFISEKENGKGIKDIVLGCHERRIPNKRYIPYLKRYSRRKGLDIFVDTSNSQSYEMIMAALEERLDVVGCNKQPYANVSYDKYEKMFNLAKEMGSSIENRTVVSANLGVIDKVREISDNGGISKMDVSLSGTDSYISYRINQGAKLSAALSEAVGKLYTEPDERDDLSGKDFARKMVVIGRSCGIPLEIGMINVEKIIPEEMYSVPLREFREMLPGSDLERRLADRVKQSHAKGCRYRYVGIMDFVENRYEIGFRDVPQNSFQAVLEECDNLVTIYPRDGSRPVMLGGPGAGIVPTVSGLIYSLKTVLKIKENK